MNELRHLVDPLDLSFEETLRLLGGYVQSDRLLNHTDDYIIPPALYPVSGLWGAYLLGKKALENA